MDRTNHYEAAFEAYLKVNGLRYLAVDESRRPVADGRPVKSVDFVVFGRGQVQYLIDVKGRRYPGGTARKPRRAWESWAHQDDIDGLRRWQDVGRSEGCQALGLLVFVYHLDESFAARLPETTEDLTDWDGRRYLLRGVPVNEYQRHMRVRSPKWGTVSLPTRVFADLVRPFRHWLDGLVPECRYPTHLACSP